MSVSIKMYVQNIEDKRTSRKLYKLKQTVVNKGTREKLISTTGQGGEWGEGKRGSMAT